MAKMIERVAGWRVAVLVCCGTSAWLAVRSSAQPWPANPNPNPQMPFFGGGPAPRLPAVPAAPRFQSLALAPDGETAVGCESPNDEMFAAPGPQGRAVKRSKSVVVLWNARTGVEARRLGAYERPVEYAAFSRDGKMLVVSGAIEVPPAEGAAGADAFIGPDGQRRDLQFVVQVWDVATGALISTLKPPVERIKWASGLGRPTFLPDGRLLTTGGYGFVPPRLWNPRTGAVVRTLDEMPEMPMLMVEAVAVSPDGRYAAVGGYATQWATKTRMKRVVGRVFVYDLESGKIVHALGEALPESASRPVTAEEDRGATDEFRGPENSEPGDEFFSLAFSPDGRRLAAGGAKSRPEKINEASSRMVISGGLAWVWDVASGRLEQTLTAQQQGVTELAFSPDGLRLAGADRDQVISVWDIERGHQEHVWAARGRKAARVQAVSKTPGPKGRRIEVTITQRIERNGGGTSSSSKEVALPDPEQAGETVTTQEVQELVGFGVQQLAFSRDGARLLALNLSRSLGEWDLRRPTPDDVIRKYLPTGSDARLRVFVFSPDSRLVASGGYDKRIRLWDMAGRNQILSWPAHTEGVTALALTPDGRTVISAGPIYKWTWTKQGNGTTGSARSLGSEIRVWDRASGVLKREWKVTAEDIVALAVSPDGRSLYTAGNVAADAGAAPAQGEAIAEQPAAQQNPHGRLRWWNLTEALAGQGEVSPVHSEDVADARVASLAVSPDGAMLATEHEEQGLRLWDAASHDLKHALDLPAPPKPGVIAFSARFGQSEGQRLAFSRDGRVLRTVGKEIQVWRASDGERLDDIELPAEVLAIALSPDGRTLAVSTRSELALWDVKSGETRPWPGGAPVLEDSEGQGGASEQLVFSPDGHTLAGASGGAIQLWSMAAPK